MAEPKKGHLGYPWVKLNIILLLIVGLVWLYYGSTSDIQVVKLTRVASHGMQEPEQLRVSDQLSLREGGKGYELVL